MDGETSDLTEEILSYNILRGTRERRLQHPDATLSDLQP